MEVIPVIDIRNGAAVRAVAGRRSEYQPLATPLARTSDPRDVARGLMSLYDFHALYIADLDAIERRGGNDAAIAAIVDSVRPARLWIDAGFRGYADAGRWLSLPNVDVVLGSESLADPDELRHRRDDPRVVLSLDFSERGFLGDHRLLAADHFWPSRLIAMTLARVGAKQGPDLSLFADIAARADGRRIYAAGGVRDLADLLALKEAGAAGALVATALHDGRLTASDLNRIGAK